MPNANNHRLASRFRLISHYFYHSPQVAFLSAIFLLALALRLAITMNLGHLPLSLDEIEYDRIAWNLSEGFGFTGFFDLPTTYRPPGYPALLSLVYWLNGADHTQARHSGAILSALWAPLTVILGRLTLDDRSGRLAGLVVALYLPLIVYANTLMSEHLFGVLLLLSLIALRAFLHRPSPGRAALAGAILALATLTTSAFAAFWAVLALYGIWRGRRITGWWPGFICLSITFFCCYCHGPCIISTKRIA
ncbi:glycosyltransferase family 39 protein [Halopseudomonas salegens]|uniref:Dolichyl-phosphate-mannose-protein mannosyltransferase n=1 Tax=Halopseudomonas salegens TaxID=1434072 RepID=A0A1H2EV73_9GAMM|nr:glycosyltransferase family 39 protein [Halopseudomonas salegens]SDT98949.1 Dolichyl-phosphate-mannose-protein mannosyltransferase [Halopseudomonas salegens]